MRKENSLAEALEQQEQTSKDYEKELELAKFHEERGKVKCECWSCEEKKQIQAEVKAEQKKIVDNYDQGQKATEKEQCPECQR